MGITEYVSTKSKWVLRVIGWSVASHSLVWVYDRGAVWPPDINPITAEGDGTFTLREVDGATTRYALIQRAASPVCRK